MADLSTIRELIHAMGHELSEDERKLLTALRFAMMSANGESGEHLFFMTGLFKAGTTWLGLMLNAHPGLYCDAKEIHSFSAQVSELYTNQRLDELPDSEREVWSDNILDAKRAALFCVEQPLRQAAGRAGAGGEHSIARACLSADQDTGDHARWSGRCGFRCVLSPEVLPTVIRKILRRC